MPLTPISTPYTSEYKPLGLESFAEPLSKMQEKFDVAKSEIDKTKYALSRMSQDDERAKKLLADLDAKTDELSKNLSRSGNYKQATRQLQELNEWFTSNKELSGMRSNYDSYKENYKLMRDRVDGENMTEKDFELWDYYVRNNFKGTNYNKSTGTYNTGDFSPKRFNLEKELEDKVLKIAAMEPEQQVNAILNSNGNVSAGEVTQQLTKYRKIGDVQRSIKNFILTGDRYKDWKQEEAKMTFFKENDQTKKAALQGLLEDSDPLQYSKNILTKSLPELQELHKDVSEIIANEDEFAKLSREEQDRANEIIEETETEMGEIYSLLESNDPNAIEQKAAGLYIAQEMGYFDKVALAGADVVDFIKEGSLSMSGGSPAKNEKIKKANEITINTQINPVNVMSETAFEGSTSPFLSEEMSQLEGVEFEMSIVNNEGELVNKKVEIQPASTMGEMFQKNVDSRPLWNKGTQRKTVGGVEFTSEISGREASDNILNFESENEALSKTTLGYEKMYDQRISTLDDEIKSYQAELLSEDLSDSEKAELQAKKREAQREKYQARYAKTSGLKDLDYLVTNYIHDKPEEEVLQIIKDAASELGIELSDEDILKEIETLKEDFNGNTVSSPQFLDNELNKLRGERKKAKTQLVEDLEKKLWTLFQDASEDFFGTRDPENDLTDEQYQYIEDYFEYYNNTDSSEEFRKLPDTVQKERSDRRSKYQKLYQEFDQEFDKRDAAIAPGELLINTIYKDFRKSKTLGTEQFYQVPEVIIDESADAFSSGQFKSLIEDGMASRGSKNSRVIWDPTTRQSIALDPAGLKHSYTLDAYNLENARFAGIDQHGQVIIAFYRKNIYNEQNKDMATWKNSVLSGTQPLSEATQKRLEAYEAEGEASGVRVKFNDKQRKQMSLNNPQVLYLSAEGLSQKPVDVITENFVDYVESANTIADPNARIEFIEKQRSNYAPFYMNSSPKISSSYNRFANTLRHRALNGIVSEIGQSSASGGVVSEPFQDSEGRVVTREYNARYQTTEKGEILVQYTEVLKNAESGEIVKQSDLPALVISDQVNLPTALAKLDLTFGTGAGANLAYSAEGGKRVPIALANLSPEVYFDPKIMNNIIR